MHAAIFNDVQENSEREWKMEMYWLLKDFEEKTILPPPLSLIETAVQLARVIHRKLVPPSLIIQERSRSTP